MYMCSNYLKPGNKAEIVSQNWTYGKYTHISLNFIEMTATKRIFPLKLEI